MEDDNNPESNLPSSAPVLHTNNLVAGVLCSARLNAMLHQQRQHENMLAMHPAYIAAMQQRLMAAQNAHNSASFSQPPGHHQGFSQHPGQHPVYQPQDQLFDYSRNAVQYNGGNPRPSIEYHPAYHAYMASYPPQYRPNNPNQYELNPFMANNFIPNLHNYPPRHQPEYPTRYQPNLTNQCNPNAQSQPTYPTGPIQSEGLVVRPNADSIVEQAVSSPTGKASTEEIWESRAHPHSTGEQPERVSAERSQRPSNTSGPRGTGNFPTQR
ncbi:uncharacterized protein [Palaemon carinicauda]|uniref:uncharacterized protein n=1 Tax=Palaemon carinicauda TaxID=392227 RepID=UPI0035B593E5